MNAIEPKSKTRRLLVRGLLLVIYAGLMAVAFTLGKGHTLLLDNKDSEDGSVKAFESVSVSVDGQEAIEFMSGDRDMAKVTAQRHTIRIDVDGKTIEKKVTIPLGMEMALVSIPKLVAGVEPALVPFILADQPAPPPDPDAGNSNEFTSPGGVPEVPAVPEAAAPEVPVAP